MIADDRGKVVEDKGVAEAVAINEGNCRDQQGGVTSSRMAYASPIEG